MIIFGAGASYDSAPYHQPLAGITTRSRPPLADDLFSNRDEFSHAKNLYPEIYSIIPHLINRHGKTVEQVLQTLRDEAVTYPRGQQQLAAVRYYLQWMLRAVEGEWIANVARGVTNQRTLLEEIGKFNTDPDPVCLLTFNYDTLIERALEAFGIQFTNVADFVSHKNFKLFKLHGSVNWARRISSPIGAGINTSDSAHVARQVIEQAASLTISSQYEMCEQPPQFISHYARYPAIAIPVEKKNDFECPEDHIQALTALIPRTKKIITIGWRAMEDPFLKLLSEHLSHEVQVLVCCGTKTDAEDTLSKLKNAPLAIARSTVLGEGFTDMIARRNIVEFLKTT